MYYYEVAVTYIVRQDTFTLTYSSQEELAVGTIVLVEVGKKTSVGVVMSPATKPSYTTKPVTKLIYETSIPKPLVELSSWLSEYYRTHLANVLQTVLPRGLDKKRRTPKTTVSSTPSIRERTNFLLNKEQLFAVENISSSISTGTLLHGVTGSGKTAVYIELVKQAASENKSSIILVPEIALTSQLVDELSQHFPDVIITHSRQTEAERHITWQKVLESDRPSVIIGPRSALFLPVKKLGYIIIDEAHEPSYKQEKAPRYSALRAASKLAELHTAKLVLGSATPSVVDYYQAEYTGNNIVNLLHPAKKITKPEVTLIDSTKRHNYKRHYIFSDKLLSSIEHSLQSGRQVLIFHNRRGSASVSLCDNCGWQAGCPRCFLPLSLHTDSHLMSCHTCGFSSKIPSSCPSCSSADIIHKGIGTKRIETELRKLYPSKTIVRFDADSEAGETVDKLYQQLYDGSIDIIIGTQVIAKGLDLPRLHTVGVIQADTGLSLPDYSSSERTFQLLCQVVGRVGRSDHSTEVVVQSYQPNHPAISHGIAQDYKNFYQYTLKERRRSNFPPFCYLLKATCVYKTEKAAISNSKKMADILKKRAPESVEILGPTPSFYERQRDTYRWQLVLKSTKRADLAAALDLFPSTHWQTELDPMRLL